MDKRTTQQRQNDFLDALVECGGVIQDTCNKAGISRKTFYNWMHSDEEEHKPFQERYEKLKKKAKKSLRDIAVNSLIKNVKGGNQRAIEFLLKKQFSEEWGDEPVKQNDTSLENLSVSDLLRLLELAQKKGDE